MITGRRQNQLNGDVRAVKNTPAPPDHRSGAGKSDSTAKNIFRIGLCAPELEISNVHSEPATIRKSVNVHFGNGGTLSRGNLAHSNDDIRQISGSKKSLKMPKISNFMKKRNSTAQNNTSSGSENGYDQKGVLRISAPFLNNPLVQHVT